MKFRMLVGVVVGLIGGAAFAAPASADPPLPIPASDPFTLPGRDTEGDDGFCQFPVLVTFTRSTAHYRESTLPDGTVVQKIEGSAFVTVMNETTGTSLSYNISGPGTVTIYTDGSFALDLHGPNLLWTTVANSFAGVPQLAYTHGHVLVDVDPSGHTASYSLSGNSVDVCAALAS
jgi:hypothetical protein